MCIRDSKQSPGAHRSRFHGSDCHRVDRDGLRPSLALGRAPPLPLSETGHTMEETHPQSIPVKAAAALPELVTFRNVTKSFGEGPHARVAIKDVSFIVHDLPNVGELIAIVGPSGCGKSTLLR